MQNCPFLKFLFLCIVLLGFLASCARQGAPSGGAKDIRPPAVDTAESTRNFSTRFEQRRIVLKFDEWVTLSDAVTQVVVSPPLAKRPEVVLKGKTVVLTFDKAEQLYPNTTYTINFGNSVKDFHEGNPAKDLRFVFSTGDFIDSLSFRGTVVDAFSGELVENISVMLYENHADTAIRKERPYYFTRTDKGGQYEFKNLRSGNFRLVAIEDADQNLKWDGENERLAFRDSSLRVDDSLRETIHLRLFKNRPTFRFSTQNANRYGLLRLVFNTPVDSFNFQAIAPESLVYAPERTSDSLLLWYDLPQADTAWQLVFSNNEGLGERDATGIAAANDTIQVRKLSRSDFLKNHRLSFADEVQASAISGRGKTLTSARLPGPAVIKTIVQPFSAPGELLFNYPVTAFDTSLWLLHLDSVPLRNFSPVPDSANPRQLHLAASWKQGKTFQLTLLPGAVTDFWGVPNADTLRRNFNVLSEKQLGSLSLNLEKLLPGTPYVLQLLNGNERVREAAFLAESSTKKLIFNSLQVAGYTARLIEDRNGNGRWDTGNFANQLQPEPVFAKKLDPLRANWEVEAIFRAELISLQDAKRGKQ